MTDTPSPSPEAARAEIASLVQGSDSGFAAAYAAPSHPGHAAARARMDALHTAAYGTADAGDQAQAATAADAPAIDNGTPAEGDVDATAYRDIVLSTLGDVAPLEAVRVVGDVRQIAAALELPPELARGAVGLLERDIARRDSRPMNELELAGFEATLRAQAGADYDRVCDALEAAVARAGKRGDTLRRALASVEPATAAWAAMSIYRNASGKGATR